MPGGSRAGRKRFQFLRRIEWILGIKGKPNPVVCGEALGRHRESGGIRTRPGERGDLCKTERLA
jgi:hypothetical protein